MISNPKSFKSQLVTYSCYVDQRLVDWKRVGLPSTLPLDRVTDCEPFGYWKHLIPAGHTRTMNWVHATLQSSFALTATIGEIGDFQVRIYYDAPLNPKTPRQVEPLESPGRVDVSLPIESEPQPQPATDSEATPDQKACIICLENEQIIAVFPCRHLAYCYKCSQQLDFCSVCKGKIDSCQRIYQC